MTPVAWVVEETKAADVALPDGIIAVEQNASELKECRSTNASLVPTTNPNTVGIPEGR